MKRPPLACGSGGVRPKDMVLGSDEGIGAALQHGGRHLTGRGLSAPVHISLPHLLNPMV